MRFFLLLKLELKNLIKKIPGMLTGAIALIFVIGVIAFCCNKYIYSSNVKDSFPVAVVFEDDSDTMKTVSDMIVKSKTIGSYLTFDICNSKDELINKLDSGDVVCGIVIQKDAAKDIMDKTNTPIDIYFAKNTGYEAAIIKEIATSGAILLQCAQSGVYTNADFYREHDNYKEKSDMIDRLNIQYAKCVFLRESAIKENIINATGDISTILYFTTSGIILFLMLYAINISTIFRRYTLHLSAKFSNNGVNTFFQTLIKYITICISYFVLIPFGLLLFNASTMLYLLLPLTVTILCYSAFILMIYELFKNKNSCIMFIFLFTIFVGFVSGCFIPSLMLPEQLSNISGFFPVKYMFDSINSAYIS